MAKNAFYNGLSANINSHYEWMNEWMNLRQFDTDRYTNGEEKRKTNKQYNHCATSTTIWISSLVCCRKRKQRNIDIHNNACIIYEAVAATAQVVANRSSSNNNGSNWTMKLCKIHIYSI